MKVWYYFHAGKYKRGCATAPGCGPFWPLDWPISERIEAFEATA